MNKTIDQAKTMGAFEVDYHIYTSSSIGTVSFDRLIETASKIHSNIRAICITDRDTVETARFSYGYQRHLQECGERTALNFIPGVEISSKASIRGELHALNITALGIDPFDADLVICCEDREYMHSYELECELSHLEREGLRLSLKHVDELLERNLHACILDAARFLVMEECFDDVASARAAIRDAMKSYPNTALDERCNVGDIIDVIHGAGGFAIWAPPLLEEGHERVAELLDSLSAMGLDGVEAYRGSLDYASCAFLENLAVNKGLLVSGGSGYDGKMEIRLGQVCADGRDYSEHLTITGTLGLQ